MKSENEQPLAETAATAKRPTSTRRSGSTTPAPNNTRLPSRPSSPSRLRSLPSVGLSNYEALSDSVQRGDAYGGAGATSHASDIDNSIIDVHNEETEDNGRSKEVLLPVSVDISSYIYVFPLNTGYHSIFSPSLTPITYLPYHYLGFHSFA
jgi:hypothetical protein